MSMTEAELRAELDRLAPFHHGVELPHGLNTIPSGPADGRAEDTRVQSLVRGAFPGLLDLYGGTLAGKRVLDVACNCGGFSFEAVSAGAEHVLGFDVVPRYIEQADLIRKALALEEKTEFRVMAIDDVSPETTGTFDVTLCLGILYHLEDPVGAMRRLSAVTERAMLVDTNITSMRRMSKPFWRMNMPPLGDKQGRTSEWRSGQQVIQFTPSAEAVELLMQFLGFARVIRLPMRDKELGERYRKGRRATFLAVRDPGAFAI